MAVLMEGSQRLRLAKGDLETGVGLAGPAAKRFSRGSHGTVSLETLEGNQCLLSTYYVHLFLHTIAFSRFYYSCFIC